MALYPYHTTYNRNVGRIKVVTENEVVACINPGRNGIAASKVRLTLAACVGFFPQVGDRVLLVMDDSDWMTKLQKLPNPRNEVTIK